MMDMITGWLAYQLSAHSTPSLIFFLVLAATVVIVWRWHASGDPFDLRDAVCNRQNGVRVVSTTKTLLFGTWVISSYLVIQHYTEVALTAYVTLWVLKSGITAWEHSNAGEADK